MTMEEYKKAKHDFEKASEQLFQATLNLFRAEDAEKKAIENFFEKGDFDEYDECKARLTEAHWIVNSANVIFSQASGKWSAMLKQYGDHEIGSPREEGQAHVEPLKDDSKEVKLDTCDHVELEQAPKLKSILKPTNYPIPINHNYISAEDLEDEDEDDYKVEEVESREEEEVQADKVVQVEESHLVEPEFIDFMFAPDDIEPNNRTRLLEVLPKIFGVGRRSRFWRFPLPCHAYPRMVLGNCQNPEPTFYRNYTRVRGWSINDLKRPWQYKFNLVFEWCFGFGISQARSFSSLSVRK